MKEPDIIPGSIGTVIVSTKKKRWLRANKPVLIFSTDDITLLYSVAQKWNTAEYFVTISHQSDF